MTIDELDSLPEPAAREALAACCAAAPWVAAMLTARPLRDRAALFAAADRAWSTLTSEQLAEAIARHPRLGATRAAVPLSARESRWSAGEQAGAGSADEATRVALERGNAEYERRFGHTFILCASGRSAEDMLAELRSRLTNDPATERTVTAGELRRITLLRLEKLLADARAPGEDP